MNHTSFQAARALLPAWVVWTPGLFTLVSLAVAWLATRAVATLALRPFLRLPPDAHWTERARLAQPARLAVALVGMAITIVTAVTLPGGPLSLPPPAVRLLVHVLLLQAVVIGGSLLVEQRLLPGPGLRERLTGLAGLLFLMFPGFLVAIPFALVAGPIRPVSPIATTLAAFAVVLVSTGRAWPLGLRLGLLRPPEDRLVRALAAATEGTAGTAPRLFELPAVAANAFALPIVEAVGVTRGALRCLDDAELVAILRHELGHLAEARGLKLVRLVNAAAVPLVVTLAPSLASAGRGLALPLAFLVVVLWLYSVRKLGRRLEQRADEAAHVQAREYASALEKLHRANLVPAVLARKTTHPDLYDRMVAAGVTPEWPKPAPPARRRWPQLLLALAVVATTFAVTLAPTVLGPDDASDRLGMLRAIALRQRAGDVAFLGRWRYEHGDLQGAATLYLAAEAMMPSSALYPAVAARALGGMGRCGEAEAALARAEAADATLDYLEDVRADLEECEPQGSGTVEDTRKP